MGEGWHNTNDKINAFDPTSSKDPALSSILIVAEPESGTSRSSSMITDFLIISSVPSECTSTATVPDEASAPTKEDGAFYQLFEADYRDAEGIDHEYNHWTSAWDYEDEATGPQEETTGRFLVSFSLPNYPYDTVLLSPSFSRSYKLAEPIEVRVK